MKKIKYLLFVVMASITFTSCLVDQDAISDTFDDGANLVGFPESSITIGTVADGESHQAEIPIEFFGPTSMDVTVPVTVQLSIVDSSTTAVEGVNYILESTTVTLNPGDEVDDNLPITILTEGIETPADEIPVLTLQITEVSSESNVVVNGKNEIISVDLAYLCPFDIDNLAGTYIATEDDFGIYIGEPEPFEVVVGPGENQITLVNFAAHPEMYDVVVDVDPATGNLTLPKQVALNYNNFEADQYGELSMEGTGTSAPTPGNCIGELSLTSTYTVGAGSFGAFNLVFERVEE